MQMRATLSFRPFIMFFFSFFLKNHETSQKFCQEKEEKEKEKEQGRIHGHQLRTGGQGRKCAFPHFSTRVHGPPTNQRTDGRTKPLIELRVRN